MAENRTMFMCEQCRKWFLSMEVFVRHECCRNEENVPTETVDKFENARINVDHTSTNVEIDKQITLQEQQEGSLIWSRQATLLLIGEYKDRIERIDNGKLKKNKAFEEISNELHTAGYSFSAEQCIGRMKTITRAYKQVKDHNAKSGNERKNYIYETELDEIYSARPNIEPKFVASSTPSQPKEQAKQPQVNEKTGKRSNSDTESEGNTPVCKVRKTQATAVISYLENVTQSLNDRHEKEQAKKDERHKERMGLFRELIDVLKNTK